MQLLILNYEYPPLGGGAGVITQTLAEGLAAEGHSVTVVTTWFEGEAETTEKENLKVIRLRSRRKFTYRSNPREMWSWVIHSKKFLSAYCSNHSFDLCLANFAIPGGETALMMKHKFNIPYIVISHGHDIPWFFPKQMFWYHVFTYFRIRHICRRSEQLVLLSQPMKTNADRFMGKRHQYKNIIISNAYDNDLFYPDYKKREKIFTIIFSGRLVEQKDPMTFLRTIQLLAEQGVNFKVEVYGDGALRNKMEQFVRGNQLTVLVAFKGWVKKEELAGVYRRGHVFVSTSLEEGMSVAILEAMASGLYVFATPVSNNVEMIQQNVSGEIIQCGDAVSLAEKLKLFFEEKFLKNYQIPEKILEEFGKLFHNKAIVEDYQRMSEKNIHKNHAPGDYGNQF